MVTIIAGSQMLGYAHTVAAIESCPWLITRGICGCAPGPDRQGWAWCNDKGLFVDFFPAWPDQMKWARAVRRDGENLHSLPECSNNRAKGFLRNEHMARVGEALVAVWDGRSPGTEDMIMRAHKHGLQVHCPHVDELMEAVRGNPQRRSQ